MKAQEIKGGMTKGQWHHVGNRAMGDNNCIACYCYTFNNGFANIEAIVSAVNNTWGKGYDPEKLLEFLQAMEIWIDKTNLSAYPTAGKKIIEILNAAKLK